MLRNIANKSLIWDWEHSGKQLEHFSTNWFANQEMVIAGIYSEGNASATQTIPFAANNTRGDGDDIE
jgi:hypothetical protein